MSYQPRLIQTAPGGDFIESTVQPRPVDINDYYTRRSDADTYSRLKPSLKPLKWSNVQNKKKNSQRELDVDALEASQKRIIYIRTFNHVKNEAIVMKPEPYAAKDHYNVSQGLEKKMHGPNDKKKPTISLESQMTLSFFRKNKRKFNPQKIVKKKPISDELRYDENSPAPKDFAFLTGVNLQESETPKQDEEEEINENDVEEDVYEIESQTVLRELQSNIDSNRPREDNPNKEAEAQKPAKEHNTLPSLKKPSTANSDRPAVSVSEMRYKQYMHQKPKMYITSKTNSVQAFGRPSNYVEHLTRVYNKEATPVVPYALVDHLGPRKDYRKAILDSYLAQFNLEALKYIDEDLYEYAKEKASC